MAYTQSVRSYRVVFDDSFEFQLQLPSNVERSTDLDNKAAALIEAYQDFANAAGRNSTSQIWYGESSFTSDSALVSERGQFA
ncbi:hypothetical protein J7E99_14870 [Streptomyces sp. ISL-44]|uniref:hypothetical protein n=1 Tax=Streptomyces sp. ISL-44 TaxID=2819184 RepID=UPI001BE94389|nr:hypothetical protein [Streptomyces sp. ISL-44]MBT2541953.1 hypothetical protein [Streptomyces sp. ISL-44]